MRQRIFFVCISKNQPRTQLPSGVFFLMEQKLFQKQFWFFSKFISLNPNMNIYFGNLRTKFPTIFVFCFGGFLWNPQLKTDSAVPTFLFSFQFHNKIEYEKKFYVILLSNVSSNNECIAVEKNLYVENKIKGH